jgi:hypothetical protein
MCHGPDEIPKQPHQPSTQTTNNQQTINEEPVNEVPSLSQSGSYLITLNPGFNIGPAHL